MPLKPIVLILGAVAVTIELLSGHGGLTNATGLLTVAGVIAV